MGQGALFSETDAGADAETRERARRDRLQSLPPRVVTADRQQLELRPVDLDRVIGPDHPARLLWHAVERLDLSKFYEPIKARENEPGRPPTDPKVFVALWLYATSDGVGSAREIDTLCREHDAYRWLRGGVPLNYHTLSDFRTAHGAAVDDLLNPGAGRHAAPGPHRTHPGVARRVARARQRWRRFVSTQEVAQEVPEGSAPPGRDREAGG